MEADCNAFGYLRLCDILPGKLIEQLKTTNGNIIVIIPKSKANTERINALMFEKGFDCYEIPTRPMQYYEDLLVQYLDSRGFQCLADTAALISNLIAFRKNQFRGYDIRPFA